MLHELLRRSLAALFLLGLSLAFQGCQVDVPSCASNADCFVGEVCLQSACVVRSLGPFPSDMRSGDMDTPDTNVTGDCRIDLDACGAKACNTRTGECFACEFDAQCGENGVCDESTGNCLCVAGFHRCSGQCVSNNDPATCGSRCSPCPTAENGDVTCDDGACDIECSFGFLKCGADCSVSPDVCVECLSNDNCPRDRPVCNAGTCDRCGADPECARFPDTKICDAGECVQCLPTRREACNLTSCNAATRTCTNTLTRSRSACEKCAADEECIPNHRCVRMEYRQATRPDAYCLPQAGGGNSCEAPYPVLVSRPSVSSSVVDSYCTITEDLISCEARNDYKGLCQSLEDCGANEVNDGLCKPFSGVYRCTYACETNDDCPNADSCVGTPPNSSYCLEF